LVWPNIWALQRHPQRAGHNILQLAPGTSLQPADIHFHPVAQVSDRAVDLIEARVYPLQVLIHPLQVPIHLLQVPIHLLQVLIHLVEARIHLVEARVYLVEARVYLLRAPINLIKTIFDANLEVPEFTVKLPHLGEDSRGLFLGREHLDE